MALARLGRQAKRPYGFCIKMTAVGILGLCFMFFWSMFSSSSSSLTSQRSSFSDIGEPVSVNTQKKDHSRDGPAKKAPKRQHDNQGRGKAKTLESRKGEKGANGSLSDVPVHKNGGDRDAKEKKGEINGKNSDGSKEESKSDELEKQIGEKEEVEVDEKEDDGDVNEEIGGADDVIVNPEEQVEKEEDANGGSNDKGKKRKQLPPLFDSNAHYHWKPCGTRTKHNYIPCIDIEIVTRMMQSYRHRERSCPRASPMCLVPLPREGYEYPVHWPESKLKIFHKNVAHPKLDAFIKKHRWIVESEEFLIFPQNQSEYKGGVLHYIESIEEMVPDIEWGKNIRVVLDIGSADSSFVASLLEKDVITLTLGLKDDLVDLAQVALERGFPAVVSPFESRRLPFPSGVFDAIHCGGCSISWHSNGGKPLLEMNRLLRPSGYFILSTRRDNIEEEEAMSKLTASMCWNILAHKADEISEVGVKIYQKPESNDIYELRRKKFPPLCKENENPDAAWYVPTKTCLHNIPSSIEERGTEWPEEWPKRLEAFPDWINKKEKLVADDLRWKAIVSNSYLSGIGIDWSNIRNVMDMKAVYGGFAAALSQQKVWVMNIVPIHAPNTLPILYERGLIGVYHDWCESFSTYPRSYDLLHADHLFSRLKNRCKQPVAIIVEMDRILRPGGWIILRDKVEILDPVEGILRSLHWEIRMTYAQDREGILCAQKTTWRP